MLPPRYVYSAWIENKFSYPIRVKVQYKMPNGSFEERTLEVAPGSRSRAEERTVSDGYANFAASINQILAENAISGAAGGQQQSVLKAPFDVHGPTRDYNFVVGRDLSISQHK